MSKITAIAHRISRWSGVLQVMIGFSGLLAGVAIGVWGIRSGERSARMSGSLEHPKLALYLGQERLEPGRPMALLLAAPFDPKTVTVFGLPLRIANIGGKTARDVTLIIRFPELIHGGINEAVERTPLQFDPAMKMTRSEARLGHFDFQSFSFSAINPRSAAAVEEPFALARETQLSVPVELRDARMSVSVEYGFLVEITVSQTDAEPLEYTLKLFARRARNETELHSQVSHYVETQIIRLRRESSWPHYLGAVLARPSEELLIAPTSVRVAAPVADGSLIQATSFASSIVRLRYNQTAIKSLFTSPTG